MALNSVIAKCRQKVALISSITLIEVDATLGTLEDSIGLSVMDKATYIFELEKSFRWRNDIAVWEHFSGLILGNGCCGYLTKGAVKKMSVAPKNI